MQPATTAKMTEIADVDTASAVDRRRRERPLVRQRADSTAAADGDRRPRPGRARQAPVPRAPPLGRREGGVCDLPRSHQGRRRPPASIRQGVDGIEGIINAPTVFNSAFNFKQFWDGRAESLGGSDRRPVDRPNGDGRGLECQSSRCSAATRTTSPPSARRIPTASHATTSRRAIATFERSLITPDSRFDRYLRGEPRRSARRRRKAISSSRISAARAVIRASTSAATCFKRWAAWATTLPIAAT